MGIFDIFKKKSGSNSPIRYEDNNTEEKLEYDVSPRRESSSSAEFEFEVEDVFTITGRGTVVTGEVLKGSATTGDIVRINNDVESEIIAIEMFRKTVDIAEEGDKVGLLLRNVTRTEVNRGDTLTK